MMVEDNKSLSVYFVNLLIDIFFQEQRNKISTLHIHIRGTDGLHILLWIL